VENKIIGLITDFGLKGLHYVAAMKSIIYSINPSIKIIDINHSINSYNQIEASFIIFYSIQNLPKNSIIICVVVPGVGTLRSILGVKIEINETEKIVIGPNNGIFSLLKIENENSRLMDFKIIEIREISNENLYFKLNGTISNTFHGRDIMAPVAAHIFTDSKFEDVGKNISVENLINLIPSNSFNLNEKIIETSILYIDEFGNCVLNMTYNELNNFIKSFKSNKYKIYFSKNKKRYFRELKLISTFEDLENNQIGILKGSSGFLELCLKRKNLSKFLNLKINAKIYLKIDI